MAVTGGTPHDIGPGAEGVVATAAQLPTKARVGDIYWVTQDKAAVIATAVVGGVVTWSPIATADLPIIATDADRPTAPRNGQRVFNVSGSTIDVFNAATGVWTAVGNTASVSVLATAGQTPINTPPATVSRGDIVINRVDEIAWVRAANPAGGFDIWERFPSDTGMFIDDWSAGGYDAGDFTIYNNLLYWATQDTTATPGTSTDWQLIGQAPTAVTTSSTPGEVPGTPGTGQKAYTFVAAPNVGDLFVNKNDGKAWFFVPDPTGAGNTWTAIGSSTPVQFFDSSAATAWPSPTSGSQLLVDTDTDRLVGFTNDGIAWSDLLSVGQVTVDTTAGNNPINGAAQWDDPAEGDVFINRLDGLAWIATYSGGTTVTWEPLPTGSAPVVAQASILAGVVVETATEPHEFTWTSLPAWNTLKPGQYLMIDHLLGTPYPGGGGIKAHDGVIPPGVIGAAPVSAGIGDWLVAADADANGTPDTWHLIRRDLGDRTQALGDLTDVDPAGTTEDMWLRYMSGAWKPSQLMLESLADVHVGTGSDGDYLKSIQGQWVPGGPPTPRPAVRLVEEWNHQFTDPTTIIGNGVWQAVPGGRPLVRAKETDSYLIVQGTLSCWGAVGQILIGVGWDGNAPAAGQTSKHWISIADSHLTFGFSFTIRNPPASGMGNQLAITVKKTGGVKLDVEDYIEWVCWEIDPNQ